MKIQHLRQIPWNVPKHFSICQFHPSHNESSQPDSQPSSLPCFLVAEGVSRVPWPSHVTPMSSTWERPQATPGQPVQWEGWAELGVFHMCPISICHGKPVRATKLLRLLFLLPVDETWEKSTPLNHLESYWSIKYPCVVNDDRWCRGRVWQTCAWVQLVAIGLEVWRVFIVTITEEETWRLAPKWLLLTSKAFQAAILSPKKNPLA
jgi:hypothetical protein